MKFLLFILFLIAVFFFNYSNEQITNNDQNIQITSTEITTTTSWWTRTFPIIPSRPAKPRVTPTLKTSTAPNRISKTVSISIPVVLFIATLLIGFGLIAYSIKTNGNRVFFLTRTNDERLIP